MLREGELDDREIEVQVAGERPASICRPSTFPGMPGAQMGMLNLGEMLGKAFGGRTKTRKMTVKESHTC